MPVTWAFVVERARGSVGPGGPPPDSRQVHSNGSGTVGLSPRARSGIREYTGTTRHDQGLVHAKCTTWALLTPAVCG